MNPEPKPKKSRKGKMALLLLLLLFAIGGTVFAVTRSREATPRSMPPQTLGRDAKALYNEGLAAYNAGDYTTAVARFTEAAEQGNADAQYHLGGCYGNGQGVAQDHAKAVEWYTKAAEQGYESAKSALERLREPAPGFGSVSVGDIVSFGSYPQGENGEVEPVEWRVLEVDKKSNKALLISRYALDCKPYNEEWEDTTWEKCTLRSWLNDGFLNSAFSEEEQKRILKTKVSADKNPAYGTNPGNATEGRVFLLSVKEAEKYFTSDEDRMCVPTKYAKAQGCFTYSSYKKDGEETCWWWLRSPGSYQISAASVFPDGSLNYSYVNHGHYAVRPALWVEILERTEMLFSETGPSVMGKHVVAQMSEQTIQVGDIVTFGSYPQGENGEAAPIEWRVLEVDKKSNKALLISRYALDSKPYNEKYTAITWEKCTLRSWLNDGFLSSAFSEEEQKRILKTKVSADKNPVFSTNPGNATEDRVFLLSVKEAEKYFTSDEDRMCVPTKYAKTQGCFTFFSYKKDGEATRCWWWMRSPGFNQYYAAYVRTGGSLGGSNVSHDDSAVRPALWVKIS